MVVMTEQQGTQHRQEAFFGREGTKVNEPAQLLPLKTKMDDMTCSPRVKAKPVSKF